VRAKKWGLLIVVGAAGLFVLHRMEGCEPEDDLAGHVDDLAALMKKHVGNPKQGVTRVFDYNREHVAGMLQAWGEIIASLDSIEKDSAREQRGARVVKVLRPALQRFKAATDPFFDAVGRDPEARRALEQRLARLKPLDDLFRSLGSYAGVLLPLQSPR
jgi:hypothetical protein